MNQDMEFRPTKGCETVVRIVRSGLAIQVIIMIIASCSTPGITRAPEGPVQVDGRALAPGTLSFPEPAIGSPVLAILIDDVGESIESIHDFLDIPLPLSFSVLSTSSRPTEVAAVLKALERDVLVHVPMEPIEADLLSGRGFLATYMSDDEIIDTLDWNLSRVPGAVGVNNHMGSRFTGNMNGMVVVMRELKARGLYFLDSRTDPATVCRAAAARVGLPMLERDVFLDNDFRQSEIEKKLAEAVDLARSNGCAIAIGHPRPSTAAAIMQFALDPDPDVAFVPVTRLFHHPCRDASL